MKCKKCGCSKHQNWFPCEEGEHKFKMKLSISVMAHPSRAEHFEYLKQELGNPPFSIDTGFGVWENCKRAWLLHDPDADFHVVIQDDAIICKDFITRAELFIENHYKEKRAFNFYFGTRMNMRKDIVATGMQNGFVILPRNMWGVAVCLPVSEIKDMIKACDKIDIRQDDIRIGRYLLKNKFDICYPMPCFIDHRFGPSLVGDPGQGRKAIKFIDHV